MTKIQRYNDLLYKLKYIEHDEKKYFTLWYKLMKNRILYEAIENNCTFICESILFSYNSVDKKVYQTLIDKIYSNNNLASSKVGDNTLLSLTLINPNLVLTKQQKNLIESQAFIENNKVYGLKYWILKNDNWSLRTKKKLVYKLFNNDNWDIFLDELENNINRIIRKYNSDFNIYFLCEYDLVELRKMIKTDVFIQICKEIELLKTLHRIRPQQWETGSIFKGQSKVIRIC